MLVFNLRLTKASNWISMSIKDNHKSNNSNNNSYNKNKLITRTTETITKIEGNIFKITKVERNIFCGWGLRNEQKRVLSRSSLPEVFWKSSVLKYLIKRTGKHLCRSLSLACRCETLLKLRLPHTCFPLKY